MKPDGDYVHAAIAAFAQVLAAGDLIAYPARLAGVDVVVLGREVASETPGCSDSAPYMVIVTDELAAQFDLSEARS